MNKACRLCLEFEANMTPIFNEDQVTSELQSKIKDFCLVEVSQFKTATYTAAINYFPLIVYHY